MRDKTLPDDGRPCNTDTFLYHLMDQTASDYDIVIRLDHWVCERWDRACEGLEIDYDLT
jgi:hypothetical protein